ncbi:MULTISPECIES: hypothetical protein [Planktothricoides]|uniref:Outer membrane protein beta-barrel domain-containing protein n=2 Tax=Planktothricoides raciborskii TaxID=132608 RepID=A0AAU8JIV1_9CYAN|nr:MULTISPECIES: hypothetical protein [Planktothricoides]KOR33865.1 hypothetical protein AM228_27290 [Planktothricoides sp. SR001]MBD2547650.1 hypothetical protein [Planktothricoides raciborskii FACHB-1370]MBD2586089.1 hypothetical protein [Planktothricoides raciborskii FACHB-1261]
MKSLIKSATLSALSIVVMGSTVVASGAANAMDPITGKQGVTTNYIGATAGGSFNTVEDSDQSVFTGGLQGRITTPNAPISLRGAALFNDKAAALVPEITYDLAVTDNANIYVGGGYSFITKEDELTALGNRNAPVVTLGGEMQLRNNVVIFGNGKMGINAYDNTNSDNELAFSVQAGAAFSF